MKNRFLISIPLFLFLLTLEVSAINPRSIQVKETKVRQQPTFLARPTGSVAYGDRVDVLEQRGVWSHVKNSQIHGWLHSSALTRKNIKKSSGSSNLKTAASRDELALAGKGFSAEVESEYKSQHAKVDFTLVDRMEQIVIPENELRNFMIEGGVIPPAGGMQ